MGGRNNVKPTGLCLGERSLWSKAPNCSIESSVEALGLYCREPHIVTPGLWPSACGSPALTLTGLERREPSFRLCKP